MNPLLGASRVHLPPSTFMPRKQPLLSFWPSWIGPIRPPASYSPTDRSWATSASRVIGPGSASSESKKALPAAHERSEEHTSELQSLMRNSYAVFCLKKKNNKH